MNKFTWFAILVSIVVLGVSSLPIAYFSLHPKDNLLFLGRRYTNSQDVYTYVSFIEQAKQGRTLFENLYTTEPQKPLLFRPSYLLIGKFASLTNLSSIQAYHAARIAFGILFFAVLWKFLDYFFTDEKSKFIAYTIILTSSGLGFLIFKFFPDSADLWIPEGNTFFALGEAPHFILSQALMLLGFSSFFEYLRHKKAAPIILSCLFFLLLSFEHPFNLVIVAPVLFVTAVWSKIPWHKSIAIALGSAVGLIYQYWSTLANPILATWNSQNILSSPSPSNYFMGFGLILILAVIAIEKLMKDGLSTPIKLTVVWIVSAGLLLYAPVNFQRRLIEGVHIPLSILASLGLVFLIQKYKPSVRSLLVAGVILILSGTSIFMTYSDFKIISQDKSNNYYYHITPEELSAIKWLGPRTNQNDVILSNWYIGNLIPGVIGRKVYLGHKIQTANWNTKNQALDLFIGGTNSSLSQKFLADNHINFIFVGRQDVLTQNGFKPENYKNLKAIYNNDGVSIYQVKN